jgi:hypothetical protein
MTRRETGPRREPCVPLASDFVRSHFAEYIYLEENHVGDLSFYSAGQALGD